MLWERNKMLKKFIFAVLAVIFAYPCLAQPTEPIGPAGWSARNWIGFLLQIAIFILAVIGIYKLAYWGEKE